MFHYLIITVVLLIGLFILLLELLLLVAESV